MIIIPSNCATTILSDPSWANVNLLLKDSGVNNATNKTFLDSGPNNYSITTVTNGALAVPTQGSISPYRPTTTIPDFNAPWAATFDGNGDYFTIPYSSAFDFSTGDWTVEAWFNISYFGSGRVIISKDTYGSNLDFCISLESATSILVMTARTSTFLRATVPSMANKWHHVAVVRQSGTNRIYLDGVQYATNTMGFSNEAAYLTVGCASYNNPGAFVLGQVSNLRIVRSAVYQNGTTFTPPSSTLTAISNTALLMFNTNNLIDNSGNSVSVTKYGGVAVSSVTAQTKPSAESLSVSTLKGSGYFTGNGDMVIAASPSGQLSSGNFCVELWAYPVSKVSSYPAVFSNYSVWDAGSGALGIFADHSGAGGWTLALNGAFPAISAGSVTYNAWTHIAVVRNGSTITMYINGVAAGSTTSSATLNGAGTTWIAGTGESGSLYFNGFVANVRTVVGSPVYTGNFTPPTSPVTAITNTSLLLNFDNAAVYDATGKTEWNINGTAKLSTAAAKFGTASVYFDGTTCLYPVKPTSGFAFASDFTIEMWFNPSTVSVTQLLYDGRPTSTSGVYPSIYLSGSSLRFYTNGADRIVGPTTVTANTWHHVALCRSSGTTRLFLNGTSVGSFSDSFSYINDTNANRPLIGGAGYENLSAYNFNGYIDDVRVSTVARYTADFTPPTEAPTQ